MKSKPNSNYSLRAAMSVPLLSVLVLASGCEILKLPVTIVDLTLNTNMTGVNTPPSAKWNSSHSSKTNNFPILAVYVKNMSMKGQQLNDGGLERIVEDEFIGSLLQKGYRVVARTEDMEKLQEEKKRISNDKLTVKDEETDKYLAALGQMANASAILIVRINDASVKHINNQNIHFFHASCTVAARMYAVQIMEPIGLSSYTSKLSVTDQTDVMPAVKDAAKIVAASIPNFK